MAKQFALFVLIVAPTYALIRWLIVSESTNWVFVPLQVVQTRIVVWTLGRFGVELFPEVIDGHETGFLIDHGEIYVPIEISAECTGVSETVFAFALIACLLGRPWRMRLKWAAGISAGIFLLNLLRLILIYPTIVRWGFDTWNAWHFWWWKYGQLIVILAAALVWYAATGYSAPGAEDAGYAGPPGNNGAKMPTATGNDRAGGAR